MLTAKLKSGERFSLTDGWKKHQLIELRNQNMFVCSVCQQPVQLKLGSKRQWHFAHYKESPCMIEHEAESPYHLAGKKLLYEWIRKQTVDVALEVYLPIIQQRPDLLIRKDNQLYALEFQCSPLSIETIQARTTGFQRHRIQPIWLFGGNRLTRHGPSRFTVRHFEWYGARSITRTEWQLHYFCPHSEKFVYLQQLTPLSSIRTLGRLQEIPLEVHKLEHLLTPLPTTPLPNHTWLSAKKHRRYQTTFPFLSLEQKQFQALLYKHHVPLSLFPIEAGWPSAGYEMIETPPHIWQTWLLFECILHQPLNTPFSFQLVLQCFRPMFLKKQFSLRFLHNENQALEHSLRGYLTLLVKCGLLANGKQPNQFIRSKHLRIPESLDNALKRDEQFCYSFIKKEMNKMSTGVSRS
ncbi:competence protein CoiA [Halalkalibacterium ligniniphilum]|uniref:competence protein CoiA n=1 Tax=Halalkalibacterium ligniniphilum TaxID=1134413 RepID=UPI00034AA22E|nr:competence protein CoiA family protein [Halalkalibacterium ligniniphilum]